MCPAGLEGSPKFQGAYGYSCEYLDYGCEDHTLETNLAIYLFYAFPARNQIVGGPEDYYCSSWGCETHEPWVKEKDRDGDLLIRREKHLSGQ